MGLYGPLQRSLSEQNYHCPTPIQLQTIPAAIDGSDVLGCAQTGTGKTAAFALPILDFLGTDRPRRMAKNTNALVLAPTRELAGQISESFGVYGKYIDFRQALVYGGVNQDRQVRALRNGVDVLVATPGRLLDLMEQRHVDLSNVEILVLDEADRMLDMGFLPALRKIIDHLPRDRQSLFFSATMPPKIRELSSRLLINPVSVNVTPKTTSVKRIDQSVRIVEREAKLTELRRLLANDEVDRTIVFTRTKHGANKLATKLERAGIRSAAIHGNKSQNARQRALDDFRKKRFAVLVATDVAARGIDIDGVTHVVNFDMPVEAESYVHRVGRTGRAGAHGIAISFCTSDEQDALRAIEKLIGEKLRVANPDASFAQKSPRSPNRNGSSSHTRNSRNRSSNATAGAKRNHGKNRRRKNGAKKVART